MTPPYTHGNWTVKHGNEEEFIRLWTEFAEWSKREVPGALSARLLRDRDNPRRFITVGPWERAWTRSSGGEQRRGGKSACSGSVHCSTIFKQARLI